MIILSGKNRLIRQSIFAREQGLLWPQYIERLGVALGDDGSQYCASDLKYYTDTESLAAYSEYAMTTRKFNQDGDLLWYANHGAACFGIAIDDSENIYVYGDAVNSSGVVRTTQGTTGYYNLRKYNSSGVLQWSIDTGFSARHFDSPYPRPIIYHNGYIYVGGTAFPWTDNVLVKIDASDGAIVWSACNEFNSLVRGITVDSSGNVFVAGFSGIQDRCKRFANTTQAEAL